MASPIPVLTVSSGADWEARLVAELAAGQDGIRIVRRCVDTAELLAAAVAGHGRAALLAADLRRLDLDAVAALHAAGVATVGLVQPGDDDAGERLRAWGFTAVLPNDATAAAVGTAVAEAVRELALRDAPAVGQRWAFAGLGAARPAVAPDAASGTASGPPRRGGAPGQAGVPGTARDPGILVAVWGPTGAPGRTTVAATLAAEVADLGLTVLVVDADVYGGTLAAHLGVLDEAPGLAAVTRSANAGTLDVAGLVEHTLQVLPGLTVLTGISRADRWPEIRPSSLASVWALARTVADVTVVDCGFCLEVDEELSFDSIAPRRNGATLAVLEAADTVLAVASADPVGLQRLVRGLDELREVVPDAHVEVVVNRVRRGPVGPDPEGQVTTALRRFAGLKPLALLPEDRGACDVALLRGRTISEVARDSRLRREFRALARTVAGPRLEVRRAG